MAPKSSLKNLIIALGVIALLAAITVAGVYELTKDSISNVKASQLDQAIAEVLPKFDNSPSEEKTIAVLEGDSLSIYTATKGGAFVGVAVSSYSDKGFSGRIKLMVGFLPDGSINGVTVVEQNETPGLGALMAEKPNSDGKPVFVTQFIGKNPANFKMLVKKDGGNVDAITASTISSRAFCDAVQRAYQAFITVKQHKNSQ